MSSVGRAGLASERSEIRSAPMKEQGWSDPLHPHGSAAIGKFTARLSVHEKDERRVV